MSHPPAEPRARRFGLAHVSLCFVFGLPAFALLSGASPGAAFAEDVRTVNRLTEMNKKALEAYAVSDFNKARQILKQALDTCKTSGLEKHPIAARTHIHMGVVLLGGLNQRDLAVRQFQKALEIQPDIQVTRNVATPEVVSAFKEALALLESGGVSRTIGAGEGESGYLASLRAGRTAATRPSR